MTLLVRDEADIVALTIEHALASGVEHVIATDNASVDHTADVLDAYRREGVLTLRHQPELNYDQAKWVTEMAREAATRFGARWIINSDADEFVVSLDAESHLPTVLNRIDASFGQVGLQQRRFFLDPRMSGPWSGRATLARDVPTPARNCWKVCHRGDNEVHVAQGNHLARSPSLAPLDPVPRFVIWHVPDRGMAHYTRKIRNGGSAYIKSSGNPRYGGHWRRDYDLLVENRLERVYKDREAQLLADAESRLVEQDTRLRDLLRGLAATAVRPDLLRAALGS